MFFLYGLVTTSILLSLIAKASPVGWLRHDRHPARLQVSPNVVLVTVTSEVVVTSRRTRQITTTVTQDDHSGASPIVDNASSADQATDGSNITPTVVPSPAVSPTDGASPTIAATSDQPAPTGSGSSPDEVGVQHSGDGTVYTPG